ncbi:MAG: protein MpaA [Planctomycetota bacterium]|jgi:protein MpaA
MMISRLLVLIPLSIILASAETSASAKADLACVKISQKLASVKLFECRRLDMIATESESVNGFPLMVKEYPPLARRKPNGRILMIGGTHGDELTSISVVFKWMNIRQKHLSGLFHRPVNPLLNPGGALQTKHSRTNANQVDLNRKFASPDATASAALDYWPTNGYKINRRYPGPFPLSEPETNWLYTEIKSFKPDIIISVHAPFSLVDYDAPDRKNAPHKVGYLYKNLMGTYPGSLGNYAGLHLGIPVITIELPHAGIMPSRNNIDQLWTDRVRRLIRNV